MLKLFFIKIKAASCFKFILIFYKQKDNVVNKSENIINKSKLYDSPKWHQTRHFEASCLTFSILFGFNFKINK